MQSKTTKRVFVDIFKILEFLEKFNYSEYAIIEVVRSCYLIRREKMIFEKYPQYLAGQRQADIGVLFGWSQGLVSILFKNCRLKMVFFKNWFSPDIHQLCKQAQEICTVREWSVLEKLLAGYKMVEIAKQFKCTKFNICLLTKSGLGKLKKKNFVVFKKFYDMLSFIKIIKSTL